MRSAAARPDLVALVADKNTEHGLRALLARGRALRMRAVTADVFVHPERDPGCLLRAHDFLRALPTEYAYALVVFDCHGCGRSDVSPSDLETEVEANLSRPGWAGRGRAIVFAPELEAWVWADSPHVESVLGWRGRHPTLADRLAARGHLAPGLAKPSAPKRAIEEALEVARKPRSSSLYADLAARVSVEGCVDSSFSRFREVLRSWFG